MVVIVNPTSGKQTLMYWINLTSKHQAKDLLKHGNLVIQVSIERTMLISTMTHQIEGTIQTIID